MKKILADIQSGKFTRDWMMECEVNQPNFKAMRNKSKQHSIEVMGKKLKEDMMPWIGKNKLVDTKRQNIFLLIVILQVNLLKCNMLKNNKILILTLHSEMESNHKSCSMNLAEKLKILKFFKH